MISQIFRSCLGEFSAQGLSGLKSVCWLGLPSHLRLMAPLWSSRVNRMHFHTAAEVPVFLLALGQVRSEFPEPVCRSLPHSPYRLAHSTVVVPFKPSGAHLQLLSQIPTIWRKLLLKNLPGTCLVLQWVVKTLCFQRRVGWVQCPVRELISYMPHG